MIKRFQQLAQLCVEKGIRKVVICPGSRNAALTIAFTQNTRLTCQSISDERSAAYIALGMAQESGETVALICTSGTAALNFSPAVAEAYFLQIPLLILTADRPAEWVHQYDGQTIFQENAYGKHVKKAVQWLPDDSRESNQFAERVSNELINIAQTPPFGPVHMNIPVREPFYPDHLDPVFRHWRNVKQEGPSEAISKETLQALGSVLASSERRMFLMGQQVDPELGELARRFAHKNGFVLIGDAISNIQSDVMAHDQFLKAIDENQKAELKPDFLMTMGLSIVSKSLKLFLRKAEIKNHWHIHAGTDLIDPFLSITHQFHGNPKLYLKSLLGTDFQLTKGSDYIEKWKAKDKVAKDGLKIGLAAHSYSDIHFLFGLVKQIETDSVLHLGNSMSVRYINLLSAFLPEKAKRYANRGTSGIDGSLSTAVGQALCTDRPVYCILGDLSFQYDKNALWNNYLPDNLKVVLLNNAGGIIFGMMDGPNKQTSYQTFFRTVQTQSAECMAKSSGFTYFRITGFHEMKNQSQDFVKHEGKALLELFTDNEEDIAQYKRLFD